ncbi:hypothetical protein Cadr_000018363 [Camelus dromedarius]|uniref:Uncharacterized protein n=1 Tax=Camelus dromedarius TaxID=9838 RepID=A0A5N4D6V6_CAMDR|nr:hypothetical protein Cadr_000018363 [Camelus dromedarius]
MCRHPLSSSPCGPCLEIPRPSPQCSHSWLLKARGRPGPCPLQASRIHADEPRGCQYHDGFWASLGEMGRAPIASWPLGSSQKAEGILTLIFPMQSELWFALLGARAVNSNLMLSAPVALLSSDLFLGALSRGRDTLGERREPRVGGWGPEQKESLRWAWVIERLREAGGGQLLGLLGVQLSGVLKRGGRRGLEEERSQGAVCMSGGQALRSMGMTSAGEGRWRTRLEVGSRVTARWRLGRRWAEPFVSPLGAADSVRRTGQARQSASPHHWLGPGHRETWVRLLPRGQVAKLPPSGSAAHWAVMATAISVALPQARRTLSLPCGFLGRHSISPQTE